MIVLTDTKAFEKKLNNIVKYSAGFIDGIQRGKKEFLHRVGKVTVEALKKYIDSNARINPEALHHVYEWYKTGSPNARIFDINYTVSNLGLSLKSSFSQSKSVKKGSETPFYNKASIMEKGIPVTIEPKKKVLVFEDDGETIFTQNAVRVQNPGGEETTQAFEKIFDEFFIFYFSQAFLGASGILRYLSNPKSYKKNLKKGSRAGRSVGIKTGYTWVINGSVGID